MKSKLSGQVLVRTDIVTEKEFPRFLDLLDSEKREVLKRLRPHIQNMQDQLKVD